MIAAQQKSMSSGDKNYMGKLIENILRILHPEEYTFWGTFKQKMRGDLMNDESKKIKKNNWRQQNVHSQKVIKGLILTALNETGTTGIEWKTLIRVMQCSRDAEKHIPLCNFKTSCCVDGFVKKCKVVFNSILKTFQEIVKAEKEKTFKFDVADFEKEIKEVSEKEGVKEA